MDSRMVRYFENKKFMWDGYIYKTKDEAQKKANEYSQSGFEVRVITENEEYLVYTRRVVKEVIVTNN